MAYDLDEQDEQWLNKHNAKVRQGCIWLSFNP